MPDLATVSDSGRAPNFASLLRHIAAGGPAQNQSDPISPLSRRMLDPLSPRELAQLFFAEDFSDLQALQEEIIEKMPPGDTLVIVSHQPLHRLKYDDKKRVVAAESSGGVVSGLRPLLQLPCHVVAIGIAREPAEHDTESSHVVTPGSPWPLTEQRYVSLSPHTEMNHKIVSNNGLWPESHGIDAKHEPFPWTDEAMGQYIHANERVAEDIIQVIQERGVEHTRIIVNDFQLALVPYFVRMAVPEARMVFFEHIPELKRLERIPEVLRIGIALGRAAAPTGLHTSRWVDGAQRVLDAVLKGAVPHAAEPFINPLGADRLGVYERSFLPPPQLFQEIMEQVGDRDMALKIDRGDHTKNILKAIYAWRDLVTRRPDIREDTAFVLFLQPTRTDLRSYANLLKEVDATVNAVNSHFRDLGLPFDTIVYVVEEDWTTAIHLWKNERAILELVNSDPSDGQVLKAHEAELLHQLNHRMTVAISHNVGAHDTLGQGFISFDGSDVDETSRAIETAIDMPPYQRLLLGIVGRAQARKYSPERWGLGLLTAEETFYRNGEQRLLAEELYAFGREHAPQLSRAIGPDLSHAIQESMSQ